MHFKSLVILILLLFSGSLNAQKKILIDKGRLHLEIYEGETFSLKIKNQKHWQYKRLVNIHDSLLIFSDDTVIKFSQLHKIRIEKPNRVTSAFQKLFMAGGIMFFGLHTVNQLIVGEQPVFSARVAVISGSLVICSLIFREQRIKRIRITDNTSIRTIEHNYQEIK